ncbi:MAG TPA: hypothetical protein VL595_22195 [Pseudonocardia sp.]|nr:hypothetical protein [Pseudonocardia sp.]
MLPDEIEDKASTRAVPLPEEAVKERPGDDRRAEAEAILGESEDRIAEAADADTPADAADEHRRSEDSA